jgi:phage regulator Rha-like protein
MLQEQEQYLRYRNNQPQVIVLFIHNKSKYIAQSEYDMYTLQKHRADCEIVWANIIGRWKQKILQTIAAIGNLVLLGLKFQSE